MKTSILITSAIAILCGCTPMRSAANDAPVAIHAAQFATHAMGRNADGAFEQYTFGKEGDTVICSRGNNQEAMTIIYEWKIVDGTTLLLTAKKDVNVRVAKMGVSGGYPTITEEDEIKFSEMDAALKTVRLQFSEVGRQRAVTMDGRVFTKTKFEL